MDSRYECGMMGCEYENWHGNSKRVKRWMKMLHYDDVDI